MAIYGGGDDDLIRRLYIIATILGVLLILCLLWFGIVRPFPGHRQSGDKVCSYSYHKVLSNRFIQINEPLFGWSCQ